MKTEHSKVIDTWAIDGRGWLCGTIFFTLTHDQLEAIGNHYGLARPLWPPDAARMAQIRGTGELAR